MSNVAYPAAPPAPRWRRRRWTVPIVIVAVAVVAAATLVVWNTVRDHPAVAAVEDFFDALRADDVDAALDLVDRVPASREFMVPEAVNFPWDTPNIELLESSDSEAAVAVVVETDDGSELVEYEVRHYDDGWLLHRPFIAITFDWFPVDYGQVNDVIVPFEQPLVEGFDNPDLTFDLLPGEYEFYPSVPGVVEIESAETSTLLEPSNSPMEIDDLRTEFAPEAVAEVQAEVDTVVDACVEKIESGISDEGCPFWIGGEITRADGEVLYFFEDLQWSVDEPVTVAIGSYAPGEWPWFPVVSETGGEPVSVTATARIFGGGFDTDTFTTTCELDFTDWSVRLSAADGEIAMAVDTDSLALGDSEESTCGAEL